MKSIVESKSLEDFAVKYLLGKVAYSMNNYNSASPRRLEPKT